MVKRKEPRIKKGNNSDKPRTTYTPLSKLAMAAPLSKPGYDEDLDITVYTVKDLFNLLGATVEAIAPNPLADNKWDRRHCRQASSGRPTASTSSMVILRRFCS